MNEKKQDIEPQAWWIYRHPDHENEQLANDEIHSEVKTNLKTASAPPWRRFGKGTNRKRAASFRPSEKEISLVNAALLLRRPLLISGRPGTGKTSLAYAVASQLGLGEVLRWSITSRTTINDGLYQYDAIARLQDTQLEDDKPKTNIENYLKLGPLGTAFLGKENKEINEENNVETVGYYPRVLLIDEIDKSDIDLPNDLLHIFEEGMFEIPELKRQDVKQHQIKPWDSEQDTTIEQGTLKCNAFPLVIMTSNGEREFPPAFLRRCLSLKVEPPLRDKLVEIVASHFNNDLINNTQVADLIDDFIERRDDDSQNLATDQLLNAIHLITQTNAKDLQDNGLLVDALWTPLSDDHMYS